MSILIFGPGYNPDCAVCRWLVERERREPDRRFHMICTLRDTLEHDR